MKKKLSGYQKKNMALVLAIVVPVVWSTLSLLYQQKDMLPTTISNPEPIPVGVISPVYISYQATKHYPGVLLPWNIRRMGTQFLSSSVSTVLVRPGDRVNHGDVLLTLDCRHATASSQAIALQAKALEAKQQSVAHENARLQSLLSSGLIASHELEHLQSKNEAEIAEMAAIKAKMKRNYIEADDCILRAPFDGEVIERRVEPGDYIRPGDTALVLMDRHTMRFYGEAEEKDFTELSPDTVVYVSSKILGIGWHARISRRNPYVQEHLHRIMFEVDIAHVDQDVPMNTPAEMRLTLAQKYPTARLPRSAVQIKDNIAMLYVVENHQAYEKEYKLIGQDDSYVYIDSRLMSDTKVVIDHKNLLSHGDIVDEYSIEEPLR
jgi:RND family efflux transporter MFP subunit